MKFRIWDRSRQRMIYHSPYHFVNTQGEVFTFGEKRDFYQVSLCTNMYDKNLILLFQYDICELVNFKIDDTIIYRFGKFVFEDSGYLLSDVDVKYKGNIWENPESNV